MGRPSTIKRLPRGIRERLDEWVRDEAVTQAEAAERVNELLRDLYPDHPPVSISAVHRYEASMREVGEKIQQGRAVAETWITRLGSQPGGKVGLLVIGTLRTLSFELSQKMATGEVSDESLPGMVDQVNKLALAAQRLERSASESVRREREIREDERKRVTEEAAKAAGRTAERKGISAETADEIRRTILGICGVAPKLTGAPAGSE